MSGRPNSTELPVAKGNTELLAVINEVIDELLKDGSIEKWVTEYSELAKKIEESTASTGESTNG